MTSYYRILLYVTPMLAGILMMACASSGSRSLAKTLAMPADAGKRTDVLDWKLTREGLFYTKGKSDQFCFDPLGDKPTEIYDLNYDAHWLHETADGYLVVDELNRPLNIFAGQELRTLERKGMEPLLFSQYSSRYLVAYQSFDLYNTTYKVLDWSANKVLVASADWLEVVKDKAVAFVKNGLDCYTLDGKLSWRYQPAPADLQLNPDDTGAARGVFPRIWGIYNNELWIQPTSGSFVVLNATTGVPIFTNFSLKEQLGIKECAARDAYLDEQTGKLKVLAYSHYVEIDLATHKAEIKKTYGGDWRIDGGTFYPGDPRVYFCGDNTTWPEKKSIGNLVVGIFNTETLEIEWHHSSLYDDKFYFFLNRPQANEKYIVVKDTNDTLLIFDRK